MGVAQIVETNAREATAHPSDQIGKFMGQAGGLFGLAIGPSANQCVARLPYAQRQQGLCLCLFVPAKFCDGEAGEGNGPAFL